MELLFSIASENLSSPEYQPAKELMYTIAGKIVWERPRGVKHGK